VAGLIRPRRWGRQRPPAGAQLLSGHPLAAGLDDFWVLTEGGGLAVQSLTGRHPARVNGSAVLTPDGLRLDGSSGGYAKTLPYPSLLPQVGVTLWVRARLLSTSTAGALLMHSAAETGSFDGWGVGVGNTTFDNAGNNLIGIIEGVAWQATAMPLGTHARTIAYTIRATNDQALWLDGLLAGSFNNTPTAPTSGSFTGLGGEAPASNPWRGPAAVIYAAGIWRRILTPADLDWLEAEPYALVEPAAPRLRYWVVVVAGGVTGTATGHAGAHGQTAGAPARLSATLGHAGAHGQAAGVSARTATATGSAGAHGQDVGVAARTGTASGSAGAHGQCVGVAAHTATATGQSGAHGQAVGVSARTSATLGHTGSQGQTSEQAAAVTGTAQGHAGTHGQAIGVAAHPGAVAGSAGAHGQCVGVAGRTSTTTGHAGSASACVLQAVRYSVTLGHAGAHALLGGTTARGAGVLGHAGTPGSTGSTSGERNITMVLGTVRSGWTVGTHRTHWAGDGGRS
jgi:hypothetical protein